MTYDEIWKDAYVSECRRAMRHSSYEHFRTNSESRDVTDDFLNLMHGGYGDAYDERACRAELERIRAKAWNDVHHDLWRTFRINGHLVGRYPLDGEIPNEERDTLEDIAEREHVTTRRIVMGYEQR